MSEWQMQAAARMTRFLNSKPRHHKTRAYLETLPKRGPIIVKPEDYPLVITRAEARLDAALQAIRDAQRYADWESRGKPASPTLPPRKDRLRPRRGHNPLRVKLYEAQNGICSLCANRIDHWSEGTIEHVLPRALGGKNVGNVLLAHGPCNNAKGSRPPTQTELAMLRLVNLRLASAGEAGTAETTQIGSVHERATAEGGDAQTPEYRGEM